MANRNESKWRTSTIATFADHLALVLYQCDGKYRVQAMVNEKQYVLPGTTKWRTSLRCRMC